MSKAGWGWVQIQNQKPVRWLTSQRSSPTFSSPQEKTTAAVINFLTHAQKNDLKYICLSMFQWVFISEMAWHANMRARIKLWPQTGTAELVVVALFVFSFYYFPFTFLLLPLMLWFLFGRLLLFEILFLFERFLFPTLLVFLLCGFCCFTQGIHSQNFTHNCIFAWTQLLVKELVSHGMNISSSAFLTKISLYP